MHQPVRMTVLAVGAALLLATCGPPDAPGRTADVELLFGAEPPDTTTRFGEVSGLTQDESGRVWVADALTSEIMVFGPDGALAFEYGTAGSGPGQFLVPCCIAFDAAGRLWVHDFGNSRYSVFATRDSGASPLFSVPVPSSLRTVRRPITFDASGRLVDVRLAETIEGGGATMYYRDTLGVAIDSVTLQQLPYDSLGILPVRNAGQVFFIEPPFGPQDLLAFGPAGVYARANSRRYVVQWYDSAGAVPREIRDDDVRAPALTQDERAEAERQIGSEARRVGVPAIELAALLPFRHTVLASLFFDESGRLWVERTASPGEPRRADVYQSDGTRAFVATWPADVDLSQSGWITNDAALGIRSDTIAGQRIVRLRWR
ncbi:MAG: hypothetical protein ACREL7_12185 [Longimicrobiales bacterium]